jgi:hypothetical protein
VFFFAFWFFEFSFSSSHSHHTGNPIPHPRPTTNTFFWSWARHYSHFRTLLSGPVFWVLRTWRVMILHSSFFWRVRLVFKMRLVVAGLTSGAQPLDHHVFSSLFEQHYSRLSAIWATAQNCPFRAHHQTHSTSRA